MSRTLEAIYQKGVLRPLEPVDLPENQRVLLTLSAQQSEDWLDQEYLQDCLAQADYTISLESVRRALAKIPGSLTEDFVAEREER